MRKLISALVLLAMLAASSALAISFDAQKYLGTAMSDFTVTASDGETFTLSEALSTHKAVLINFWATWCPGCGDEFSDLQAAYEAYGNDVAFISLSIEEDDTQEVIAAYVADHGITFSAANGRETGLTEVFTSAGVPVNIAVDRFGNIVLIEAGSFPSAESVKKLCSQLADENYKETAVIHGYPQTAAADSGFIPRKDNRDCINQGCD